MSQDVTEFKKLLDDFKKVYDPNKPKYEPTYLEICDYPGSRKEEICSRLLAFFFDSHNPHGLGTLFYDSLLEVYKEKYEETNLDLNKLLYQNNVTAQTEIYTSNDDDNNRLKRIDLLLESDCSIVCIENKIWAELKNNLDVYFRYTERVKGDFRDSVYVILSMREDMEKMLVDSKCENKGKYKVIYYREFLKQLKKNLGDYVTLCNAKYLSVLTDFIQFLDREGGFMNDLTEEEKDFFRTNNAILEKLMNRRNEYIKELSQRRDKIVNCLNEKDRTALSEGWWRWPEKGPGTGLGAKFAQGDEMREIGVEAGFSNNGEFNINFTIWQSNCASERAARYEKILETKFERINQKWVAKAIESPLSTNIDDEIVNNVYEIYKKVRDAVNQVNDLK